MHRIWKLVIAPLVLIASCNNHVSDRADSFNKKIEVESNSNVHTAHFIELFVWPGEYPTRPIVVAAQEHFAPYKDHPAIIFSDSILQNEVFYFDELTEILLYLEDLPSTNFRYTLSNSPYAGREQVINRWMGLLSDFYQDAQVESFLRNHSGFYRGAQNEVQKNLPPADFISQIESYYRTEKCSYTIIAAPEMPTGGAYGQRGIGPYIYTDEGMKIFQIISASLPVEKDSYSKQYEYFGFDNKEFTLRNSYHEFGHAFVNTILSKEENLAVLDSYRHLFTPKLQERMQEQNYGTWFDCIAEHLVRLGEIRLADRSGDLKWSKELRSEHTNRLHFVFMPELEDAILMYEADSIHGTFEEYLPELFRSLDNLSSETIDHRITAPDKAAG